MKIPAFENTCIEYLTTSTNKRDVIMFALHRLKAGDKKSAIYALDRFKRDDWPETYRSC